jgi:hypothetical protein
MRDGMAMQKVAYIGAFKKIQSRSNPDFIRAAKGPHSHLKTDQTRLS